MWCRQCSLESAVQEDRETGQLRCANCQAALDRPALPTDAVRQAREIISRWTSSDLLDRISSFSTIPPLSKPSARTVPAPSEPVSISEDHSQQDQSEEPSAVPEVAQWVGDEPDNDDSDLTSSKETETVEPESAAAESVKDRAATFDLLEPDDNLAVAAAEESIRQTPVRFVDVIRDRAAQTTTEPLALASGESAVMPKVAEDSSLAAHPADEGSESCVPEPVSEIRERPTARLTGRALRNVVKRRLPRRKKKSSTFEGSNREFPDEQGMDAVNRKLRIDRPVEQTTSDVPAAAAAAEEEESTPPDDPRAQDAHSVRRYRIDDAERFSELSDGQGRVRTYGRPRKRYIDEPHDVAGMRGPHFPVSAPQRSNLTSITGQFLAYTGVLGLTVGTAVVIYGHFGGHSDYTPTGWLVTTVAQMLLFLGIINLVSGGIEQNNEEVSRRINVLGEQLMRIEHVTESALRGPKISAERYSGGETTESVSERDTVAVDERG